MNDQKLILDIDLPFTNGEENKTCIQRSQSYPLDTDSYNHYSPVLALNEYFMDGSSTSFFTPSRDPLDDMFHLIPPTPHHGHDAVCVLDTCSEIEKHDLFFPHISFAPCKRTCQVMNTLDDCGMFSDNEHHRVTPQLETSWTAKVPYRYSKTASITADSIDFPIRSQCDDTGYPSSLAYHQHDSRYSKSRKLSVKLKPYQPKRSISRFGIQTNEAKTIFNPYSHNDDSMSYIRLANPLSDSDSCSSLPESDGNRISCSFLPNADGNRIEAENDMEVDRTILNVNGSEIKLSGKRTTPCNNRATFLPNNRPKKRLEDAWLWLESVAVDRDFNDSITEAASSKFLNNDHGPTRKSN